MAAKWDVAVDRMFGSVCRGSLAPDAVAP